MRKRALTTAAVERISPPQAGQSDHYDAGYPGLALRVSYGGARAWTFFYRLNGRLHRMTLGRYPSMTLAQARDAWRDARALVGRGEDPARTRPAAADSFAAVFAEWIKRDQGENRTAGEVKRVIEHDIIPAWRDRMITTITRRDAVELIDRVVDRGSPIQARRLHTYLHRLFKWSVGRGIIDVNPMTDLPKPSAETKRDRVLSDAELAAVWKALETVGWPFGPAIQLLILTGARRDEIGALRWSEIRGDWIKLEGARTKNREAHDIPLAPSAIKIVENLPRVNDSGFVFTTTGKTSVSGWSKAKSEIDELACEIHGSALPPWRLHDLRRTCATGLQRLGAGLQVIEAVLGHIGGSRAGIIGVYQRHSFQAEKRAALEDWARHIERLATGAEAKVIPIKRGTA
jgi:integrase